MIKINLGKKTLSFIFALGLVLSASSLAEARHGPDCKNFSHGNMMNCDFRNKNFVGKKLRAVYMGGANLSGANLSGVDLTYTNLSGANLTGANLTGAKLEGVVLYKAKLAGANITGTIFTPVSISGVTSGKMIGKPKSIKAGISLAKGYLVGPGADLTGASLDGANLSGSDLSCVNRLGDIDWETQVKDFDCVKLQGAKLHNADLSGANLSAVSSGNITGTPKKMPLGVKLVRGTIVGPGVDLRNANLDGSNLTGADISCVTFPGALVKMCSNLTGANLSGANLSGVKFAGVVSGNIKGTPKKMPTGSKIANGYLVGPGVDLTNANLKKAALVGVDLSNSILTGADLAGADLSRANLTAVQSGKGSFVWYDTEYVGSIKGIPKAMPAGYKVAGGFIVGPGITLTRAKFVNADFSAVDFSGMTLSDAVFIGGTLQGASLSGATLVGISSQGVKGSPKSMPTDWKLVGGFLIGPGAYLRDKNLSGLDLSGVVLTKANLEEANLSGANLSGANLSQANMNFTKIDGTNLSGTNLTDAKLYTSCLWKFEGVPIVNGPATVVDGTITGNPDLLCFLLQA